MSGFKLVARKKFANTQKWKFLASKFHGKLSWGGNYACVLNRVKTCWSLLGTSHLLCKRNTKLGSVFGNVKTLVRGSLAKNELLNFIEQLWHSVRSSLLWQVQTFSILHTSLRRHQQVSARPTSLKPSTPLESHCDALLAKKILFFHYFHLPSKATWLNVNCFVRECALLSLFSVRGRMELNVVRCLTHVLWCFNVNHCLVLVSLSRQSKTFSCFFFVDFNFIELLRFDERGCRN